jgi:hypothetical protein
MTLFYILLLPQEEEMETEEVTPEKESGMMLKILILGD